MPMLFQSVVERIGCLAKELGWSKEKGSGQYYRYRADKKTQLSVYGFDDDPQTIEVGLADTNLAVTTGLELEEVQFWVHGLQTTVARYAQPKTRYKYPRVAISTEDETERLINAVRALVTRRKPETVLGVLTDSDARVLREIWSRRGQVQFRRELLRLYEGKCAITGCTTLPALEAAHITPFADDQHYDVQRGLLLRADVHTLFDLAIISIDPKTRMVVVNPMARGDYGYLQDNPVALPVELSAAPRQVDLEAHFNRWSQNFDPKDLQKYV